MAKYASGGETGSSKTSVLSSLPEDPSFEYLKEITDGFSKERRISEGLFGTHYKAITEDKQVISVMKLEDNAPLVKRGDEYKKLVQSIMALKHDNIVQLIRFYHHEEGKGTLKIKGKYFDANIVQNLLCYEYVPNGSLHKYIFAGYDSFDWATRFKIIKGICQGLCYLHGLTPPILHMDLKPENILLNEHMTPKIADFALSRFFGGKQTGQITQTVVGSYGYIAPEYRYSGSISTRSDIYSLGMVIIETTTGEENIFDTQDPSARKFVENIRKIWTEEYIVSIYSNLDSNSLKEVLRCIKIGLDCVEIERNKRPLMMDIVRQLNGE